MTNEEKILALLEKHGEMLEEMRSDISGLKSTQEAMQADISGLKSAHEAMQDDISGIKVRLDVEVNEKFNLLAENQQIILDRLPDPEDAQLLERRVDTLELAVRKLNREISELKKAQ